MASVVINGDTSGSITLSAPAVAGTNTLSLPANTGTIITTASSGQSIPKAALPTGSVLQVVSSSFTTQYSTNSTSFVDTGISLSITPTSATSKIFLSITGTHYGTGQITFARGTTQLQLNASHGFTKWGSSTAIELPFAMEYLDSPATTSSTTYRIYYLATSGGSGSYWVNISPNTTTFTLMEIAA